LSVLSCLLLTESPVARSLQWAEVSSELASEMSQTENGNDHACSSG
jgi:hypothetical protein